MRLTRPLGPPSQDRRSEERVFGVSERWFGPVEMATRLGISRKALRLYERAGLVKPARSDSGWRAYGPQQAARLHQILALKGLGLTLKQIAEVLAGRLVSLDAVLALQERVLEGRLEATGRALALLSAARAKLARTGSLSPDELCDLTRETAMTDTVTTPGDWQAAFEPLIEKHYTPEEAEAIGRRKQDAYAKAGFDEAGFTAAWEKLFQELHSLRAANDASSARATKLVRDWNEMVGHFTGGDAGVLAKTRSIWAEATADPSLAPRLPVQQEDFAFIQRIADGMRARGELPPRT